MPTFIALRRRRDSKADWSSNATVLKDGQLGFEEGTAEFGAPRIKYGDGTTAWDSLPYINRKNNLEAAVDPTTSNDDSENYSIGSLWCNVNVPASPTFWVLTDLSSGATWVQLNSGGGGGSQTLTQTLVLGNTTGGNDVVFSVGDSADFTAAGVLGTILALPSSTSFEHISAGTLSFTTPAMVWRNSGGTQFFDVNEDGSVTVGAGAIDGSLIFNRDTFAWDIAFETITAARTETKPDADIDWTGATDGQALLYDVSTDTWSPADAGGTSTPLEESFTATASQTNFTLSNTPVAAWVWKKGVAQDASTWSISGDDIVLSSPANSGDEIEIYYLTSAGVFDESIFVKTVQGIAPTLGDVTFNLDDVADGGTRQLFTESEAEDAGAKSGTSFPVTPNDYQRFFRTDLGSMYEWDASRSKWLSTDTITMFFINPGTALTGINNLMAPPSNIGQNTAGTFTIVGMMASNSNTSYEGSIRVDKTVGGVATLASISFVTADNGRKNDFLLDADITDPQGLVGRCDVTAADANRPNFYLILKRKAT